MARQPRIMKRNLETAKPEFSKLTAHHVGLTKLATARLLQVPGGSHVAAEQPEVGSRIIDEALFLRVPDQFAVKVQGDFTQMTERVGLD